MFCPKCGTQQSEGTRFCTKCGCNIVGCGSSQQNPRTSVGANKDELFSKSGLFSFSGRRNSKQYLQLSWILLIAYTLVTMVVTEDMLSESIFLSIIFLIFCIAFIWISLANDIKRFHDFNKSGWWIIPYTIMIGVFMFIVGLIGAALFNLPPDFWESTIVGTICSIISFIPLSIPASSRGRNNYGVAKS